MYETDGVPAASLLWGQSWANDDVVLAMNGEHGKSDDLAELAISGKMPLPGQRSGMWENSKKNFIKANDFQK